MNNPRMCRCGDCGLTVAPKRLYRQGHDAKHVARLVGRYHEARNRGDHEGMRATVILADAELGRKLFDQFRERTVLR
jgi:hypothetical protein